MEFDWFSVAIGAAVVALPWVAGKLIERFRSDTPLAGFRLEKVLDVHQNGLFLLGTLKHKPGHPTLLIVRQTPIALRNLDALLKQLRLRRTHHNDIYTDFVGVAQGEAAPLKITMICPAKQKHIEKYTAQKRQFFQETPQIYRTVVLPMIESEPASRIGWVYNILDKKKESESIILEDTDPSSGFILLPDTKWAHSNEISELYCLALCLDRQIRSLRDLNESSLPLLRNIRDKCLAGLAEKFGVDPREIRVFVHYPPSYYHFHVHFSHYKQMIGSSLERSHLLDTVIDNIERDDRYYEKCTITHLLGENELRDRQVT